MDNKVDLLISRICPKKLTGAVWSAKRWRSSFLRISESGQGAPL